MPAGAGVVVVGVEVDGGGWVVVGLEVVGVLAVVVPGGADVGDGACAPALVGARTGPTVAATTPRESRRRRNR
jgi:hypothetical protein